MTKRLSENAMQRLQDIANTRGGQSDFVKKAKIRPETFRAILSKGHAKDEVVQKVIKAFGPVASPVIVQTIVCTGYGITPEKFLSGNEMMVREARHIGVMMMRSECGMSRPQIREFFGFDDETAVTKIITRMEERLSVETELQDRVNRIRIKIQAAA